MPNSRPEQHGIGDVVDLELVEAEQLQLGHQRLGYRSDRVGTPRICPWRRRGTARIASCISSMNSWKCTRRLALIGASLEKQVHQHGLAATDLPHEVGARAR